MATKKCFPVVALVAIQGIVFSKKAFASASTVQLRNCKSITSMGGMGGMM
ncbi:hypothetical protein [Tissierella sp.]|nr:hypothetical protein [Tissierella sp.]MDR7856839.1 hypothetical protein [Tissierella sp.]